MHDERILVTAALPYANGAIHLGHLVEYIQTDIYVRFLKMTGRDAAYICADDTHGAPIELNAAKEGVTPEAFIERWHRAHARDFAAFDVDFDIFYTTHSEENRRWVYRIYEALRDGGHLVEREIEQLYCENDARFLPDRFVKGTCPKCGAPDQYGDVCEKCNTAYKPTDLEAPRCAVCGGTPVVRKSTHIFMRLSDFTEFLKGWTSAGTLQPEIRNFIEGWLAEGLQDWCVTRDAPYFGFEVPDRPGKYFYVWMDAPVGYISSTERWCRERGDRTVEAYWERPGARIIHFIGRDIVYFHTLFWPAMLEGAKLALPSRVIVHGMLTINGEKMSKTRGTFINASEYLEHLDPTWLRYYYAGNLSARPEDLDLNFDDFLNRINAELVDNLANLCHRAITFAHKFFEGRVTTPDPEVEREALGYMERIRAHYEALEFRKAVREICALGDFGNEYFQKAAPWAQRKRDPEAAQRSVTTAVNLAKLIAIALKPIVPRISAQLEEELKTGPLAWSDACFDVADRTLGAPRPLARKVERQQIDALLSPKEPAAAATKEEDTAQDEVATISYETFQNVELKAGQIVAAEKVKGADRLLHLKVDLGEAEPRSIVAGIATSYGPEELVGRTVVVVANLKPRKLRGVSSQGMLLAAEGRDGRLHLATLPDEVAPGTRVK